MRETYVNSYSGVEHHIVQTIVPFPQAQFAMDMMKHLAVATGYPDGESSDGRSKLRLMTPEEIVDRCVEITERSFAAFDKKGWLLTTSNPLPEEITREEADVLTAANRLELETKLESSSRRLRERQDRTAAAPV